MSVRSATDADYEAVVALYREFGNKVPPISGSEGKTRWKEILKHPGTHTRVDVDSDGTIAAIATLHVLPNMTYGGRPYAFIENVISAPAARGKGCATRVMKSLIDTAWEAGTYKIMLLTASNPGGVEARGFYEKLGFSHEDKNGMTLRRIPGRFS